MPLVKKKLELDEMLIQKLQNIYGNSVSLTAIVSICLEELIFIHEEEAISLRTLVNKGMRNAKDAISNTSEIQSDDE